MTDPIEVTVPLNEDGSFDVPDGFAVLGVVTVHAEVRDENGNIVPQEGETQ